MRGTCLLGGTWMVAVLLLLVPQESRAAAEGVAPGCAQALASHRKRIERLPMEKRLGPILEAIAASCVTELPQLARAAARGARAPRAERAALLGPAGGTELGGACKVLPWEESADRRAPHCLRGLGGAVKSTSLLADIDSGTAVFASALGEHLGKSRDGRTDALFNSLLLAAALEGEDLRQHGVSTTPRAP